MNLKTSLAELSRLQEEVLSKQPLITLEQAKKQVERLKKDRK